MAKGEVYVYREGLGVIPKSEAPPRVSGPYVRADGMDAIECPADGRTYDSKSAYYAAVRAAGCEITAGERVRPREASMPPVGPDLRRALQQLQSR